MPRRHDIKRIMIVGSGPIVIGQACEFDYSGTQAVKALKSDGYEVVLVNSNPATIMTDPELCDRTYIEPLTVEYAEKIIARERPDAILPTVGGQTALNLTLALADAGILKKYNVELIGASAKAIRIAEDREEFRVAMQEIGLEVPKCAVVKNLEEAQTFAVEAGFPVIIRPSFTMGGSGGGIAYNVEELEEIVTRGLDLSPVKQVQVDESLIGWKEYELEVMRDHHDNVVIVCSIENLDPMGVHTGDSITVAPAQTLTDREYQRMRDAARAILRKVGVDTGGSNVQFGVNPKDGRLVVIEMNPRVSRSSALASKATGFPIAKIAAKLAVGYTLDEIANDITKKTPASFEPTLDYVVTKIPKFAFEKFPGSDPKLGTQMKSVGEVMAIGRTFRESIFKALRSLEAMKPWQPNDMTDEQLGNALSIPSETRLRLVIHAFERNWSVDDVARLTHIDPWFLVQIQELGKMQQALKERTLESLDVHAFRELKENGFSDRRIATQLKVPESKVREQRQKLGVRPVFKRVDTCAAEFESFTPYMYSSYEEEDESDVQDVKKVMILGSGPNRIGQGIEFDYCCCHAAFALRDMGVQSIMVNCNPETVSTDYDTSDRLYFEPLTLEDVMEIVDNEKPYGVIVQLGGQTPLNLTQSLHELGVNILGTSADSIDLAEDRERFNHFLDRLGIAYPAHAFANSIEEAHGIAERLGYPVLVRPSYVLGGRAMAIVNSAHELARYVGEAFAAAPNGRVLIDRYLDDAFELDVDALSDGKECIIAGILEHIEEAGVHSGDSSAVLPTFKVAPEHLEEIRATTRKIAVGLGVVGLMNIQFAIYEGKVYVLEVNPRASRTVPFIAKAAGVPLVKIATRLMLGSTLKQEGLTQDIEVSRCFVKAPVFPFAKFPGVDPKLSPEMKSTGEVMGIADHWGLAYYKAQLAAGMRLPWKGTAFITVNERDYENVVDTARRLVQLGFNLVATRGNARVLRAHGLEVRELLKVSEGRPNCVDAIKNGEIDLIINTPLGYTAKADGWAIRTAAVQHRVPCLTTLSGAAAAAEGIAAMQKGENDVLSLQEMHAASVFELS
jgi:carbamoyl-phosphate synthase large subunit